MPESESSPGLKQFNIKLDPSLIDAVRRAAAIDGVTLTDYVTGVLKGDISTRSVEILSSIETDIISLHGLAQRIKKI